MKLNRLLLLGGLIVAFCITGFVGANATHMLSSRPTAVAVVDIAAVLDSMKEKMQIEADLRTQQEEDRSKAEAMASDLKALESDLDILARGTPAYDEKLQELDRKIIEVQSWQQYQQQKYQRESARQMIRLYQKISAKAGEVAKENGYDIVLYKDQPIDVDFRKVEPKMISSVIKTLVSQRKMLWSSDEIDITEQLIQRMNNEFSNLAQ